MKKYHYRYTGGIVVNVGQAGLTQVQPGSIVDSPVPIRHPHFVPVKEGTKPSKKARPPFRVYVKDEPKEAPSPDPETLEETTS